MRILYECDLAGSRYHGMAYRIFQFSCEFKKRGHEVLIVAASYSHARRINPVVTRMLTDEKIEGINYIWIKTPKYIGNGIGRVIHMLVYNFRLWYFARKIAHDFKPDVVIASGVTPFDFIGCNRIAKKANVKMVLEVGDLWPLSPIELGGFSRFHPFIIALQWAENYSFRNCDALVTLLPKALDYMVLHGLKPEKSVYIPNGIYTYEWDKKEPIPPAYSNLISELKSKGNILIAYTGAHGKANDLETLIEAAKILKNTNIAFLLVGSGSEKEKLKIKAASMQLTNLFFLNPIPKNSIPVFLDLMDVLYIGLQKQPVFRFGISPNKMFDYMMAGKPIIQAIDAGNNLVKEADCGVYAEPGNVEEISSAILHLKALSTEERERLGNNGRKFVLKNHSYDILTEKYLNVIKKLITNE